MEQETVKQETLERNVLREIILNLKRSIVLMIAIIILALGVGYTYAKLREPEFIAEEQVIFSMGDGTFIQSEINAMYAHHPTVLDFVDSGVVVDRANFYYEYFVNENVERDYSIDQFISDVSLTEEIINSCEKEKEIIILREQKIKDLENIDSDIDKNTVTETRAEIESLKKQAYLIEKARALLMDIIELDKVKDKQILQQKKEELLLWEDRLVQVKRGLNVSHNGPITATLESLDYVIDFYKTSRKYYYDASKYDKVGVQNGDVIFADRIGVVQYEGNQEHDAFVSGITYKDSSYQSAIDKAKIIALAFDIETLNFFDNMNARIKDLGTKSCTVDVTTTKIMIIATLIGVVVACGVVYIKIVLDKTVKDKAEAEKITGATVLACISKGDDI